MTSHPDEYYMRAALAHARRGLGHVAPNPSVGCVIVNNGHIISYGRTHEGGRPHAEAEALKTAGKAAKQATVYVTLEPCAHPGRDGPCSDALIKADVRRVVIGCIDPNPQVNGQGIDKLKNAGIQVELGVLEAECSASHAGFFLKHSAQRPYVTLKLASSADGMIAAEKDTRTQISGKLAQRYTHLLRSQHDAILVGSETFLIDKPRLTTRIDGYRYHDIKRFVFDRRTRTAVGDGLIALNHNNIADALTALALEHGVTRLLVEGGAALHESFLESGFVDEFQHIKCPQTIGKNGVHAHYIADLQAQYGLFPYKNRVLGEDTLEIYHRKA